MALTILITGASSGIGYEAARMLAEKGHKVYGAARRTERMESLRQYGVLGNVAKPMKNNIADRWNAFNSSSGQERAESTSVSRELAPRVCKLCCAATLCHIK
ncbi:MAG: SDR family NAD(P)-dependent oxidoreductase [Bacteroidales bacterium]|nr:SDR family NAD(P)-dependent oxidoreductase [Bacteroidales bacterium]